MSGVAGGNRIKNEDIRATFDEYVNVFLNKVPNFVKANLSGSAKLGIKESYGDLDLIVLFNATDKTQVKKDIIKTIETASSQVIVPFKSEKYKNKRYHNAGELVSVLFPIKGKSGEFIQIDNIIALTEQEHDFKNNFLDLPAEKQGLMTGLAKAIMLEVAPEKVFNKLNIRDYKNPESNQEYEFDLSSNKLTLRLVTFDEELLRVGKFKEIKREDIWASRNWEDVLKLFSDYNLNGGFEDLLKDIALKLKNPRSKHRIKGNFKALVSVKSGEVGTQKAFNKEKAIKEVERMLSESFIEFFSYCN